MCKLVFLNGNAYCETVCQCFTTKERKTKGDKHGATIIGKKLADVRKAKKLADKVELTPKQKKERKEKRKEKLANDERRTIARLSRRRRSEKYLAIDDVTQEGHLLAIRRKLPQVSSFAFAFANARRDAYPHSRYMTKHGLNTQDVSSLKHVLQTVDDTRLQDVLMSIADTRQRELVEQLAAGYTLTEIAKFRGVSPQAIHKSFSKVLLMFETN